MLSLATSVQTNKGYATGEKNRERFNLPIANTAGAYDNSPVNNPVGFNGYNYIGGFDSSLQYTNFVDVNASKSNPEVSGSKALRVTASATNGYTYVWIKTLPNISYTFSIDIVGVGSSNAAVVMIGTSAANTTYYSSGNVGSPASKSVTFTPAETSVCLTLLSKGNTKTADFDNASFKRA